MHGRTPQNDVKFVDLRIFPESLQKIIFVAFHANPIGTHLDTLCTSHCICQHYFWPVMYQYTKCLVKAFPGCSLSNIAQICSSDLVYDFPINTPMCMLFIDIYSSVADLNFNSFKHYLITAYGMTAFGTRKPTIEQTAEAFAAALMKIWFCFGFFHTIVVYKASAILGVFAD